MVWKEEFRIDAAFKVENSTAIYSGLLRFADLNIVAPQHNLSNVYCSSCRAPQSGQGTTDAASLRHLDLRDKVKFLPYETIDEIDRFFSNASAGLCLIFLRGSPRRLPRQPLQLRFDTPPGPRESLPKPHARYYLERKRWSMGIASTAFAIWPWTSCYSKRLGKCGDAFKSRLLRKGLPYWSSGGTLAQDESDTATSSQANGKYLSRFANGRSSMPNFHPAQRATVYSGDGDIDVINVHVPNGSQHGWDKIETLEGIANVIQDAPDDPRILAGDFNEPIEILPNGEIITSGKIAADGSVRRGRRPGELSRTNTTLRGEPTICGAGTKASDAFSKDDEHLRLLSRSSPGAWPSADAGHVPYAQQGALF